MTEEKVEAEEEAWPAFDEEDEAWPEQPAKDDPEDEPWPEETEVEHQPTIVKGEPQKDAADDAMGVETVLDHSVQASRGEGGMQVKEKAEEEDEEDPDGLPAEAADAGTGQAARVTKEDLPAYEPTSPASEEHEDVQDSKGFASGVTRPGKNLQGPPARRERQERKVIPCPAVLVGSQFTKECLLKPSRWVEVGRQPKAHILLQNPAVSKHHCKLQWRKGSSSVDLRVLDGVTHVNDRRLSVGSEAVSLKHGDLIRIYGKGVCFRFLIDMKHINGMLPEVRTMSNFMAATKESQHSARTPEEELQRKVRKMRVLAAAAREKAMQYEERLVDIQTNRTLRLQKVEEEQEKIRWHEKDEQRLEDLLVTSRDEWLDRLQLQSEVMEKASREINMDTIETQLKRDTLTNLHKEEDRRLHPERHLPSLAEPKTMLELPKNEFSAKPGEADGEEEAFADVPARGLGIKDDDEKVDLAKPTIEVLKTAPTGADDDIADLFGDFDSEDEVELDPKRQRLA